MKKFILIMTLIMGLAVSMNAQTALVDNGTAKDNWYVGIGVGTNVWSDVNSWTLFNTRSKFVDDKTSSWWRTQPLHFNATVGKMLTPYFGLEADYLGAFNLRCEPMFIDAHNLTGNFVVNLSNLLGGYNGTRRCVEFELVGGVGWLHRYNACQTYTEDDPSNAGDNKTVRIFGSKNAMSVRGAIRANFNINEKWAITATSEYVWLPKNVGDNKSSEQDVNLAIGVKYRIPTARGGFHSHKVYNQSEIDALNAKVQELQETNNSLAKANDELSETVKKLLSEGQKVVVKTQSVERIYFERGESEVTDEDVAKVVEVLKGGDSSITLTGLTSPEGSEAFNKELASKRANAVKVALVRNGIDESRITIDNNYETQRSVVISVK